MTLAATSVSVTANGRTLLDSISLQIGNGEVVAVAGPNGAGKSTLLRVLAGVGEGPEIARRGGVVLDGRPIEAMSPAERGRSIAYLPQERTVHWALAVERVVALGRLPHGGAGLDADNKAIEAALAAMDLAGLRGRSVARLSGGERARVLVGRALAQQARFVIADEPTAGLDPAHALDLFGHFRRIAADGRSVVVALHDLSLARRYCDRIVLLRDGLLEAQGLVGEVLSAETLARTYGIRAAVGEVASIPVIVAVEPLTRRS
jgi:iron complex transport system ATP-binding protein